MNAYDAAEEGYKNGYRKAMKEIRENPCEFCNGEYNQEFMCFSVRRHTSSDSKIKQVPTKFCPNCGRDMRTRMEAHHGAI